MDVVAASGAGLLAGAVMSAVLYLTVAIAPGQMRLDLFRLLGTLAFPRGAAVYVCGAVVHAALSVAAGLVYLAVFQRLQLASNLAAWGAAFGLVHYLLAGMALVVLPEVHPRVRAGELPAPGAYALKYSPATAAGLLLLHLLYGALVGALYPAFI
jgi:hypothetical protein